VHGSAELISYEELRDSPWGWLDPDSGGVIVGREGHKQKLVYYTGNAHLITLAPTGAGKGVSTIIPNLLTYRGSIFCIDPKGENAMITARRRIELGQTVVILDPWSQTGQPSCSWNPFDMLKADDDDLIEDASLLAEALIVSEGKAETSHWTEEARAFIRGLILYIAIEAEPEDRNLVMLRQLLGYGPEDFLALLEDMQACQGKYGRIVGRAATQLLRKSDKGRASVLSTCSSNTNFLDSPRMAQSLTRSDFDMEDLKRRQITVYVVIPPERLTSGSRWLRLLTSFAINAAARVEGRPRQRILYLLDEFAALGRLEKVEEAVGLMRGYGIWLWPILQDLNQLKALYPGTWESFMANSGLVQAFGVNDLTTAQWVSARIGQTTVHVPGNLQNSGNPDQDITLNVASRPLLLPQEVIDIDHRNQLVIPKDDKPMCIGKIGYKGGEGYWDAPEFKGMFDPNPWMSDEPSDTPYPETDDEIRAWALDRMAEIEDAKQRPAPRTLFGLIGRKRASGE
jgi:type IV secretion system protein VirD4